MRLDAGEPTGRAGIAVRNALLSAFQSARKAGGHGLGKREWGEDEVF
jgi:hypothetical protein